MSRLLAALRSAGVELAVTARGTLRVKSGAHGLTPELKAEIVAHRDELLAALEAERAVTAPAVVHETTATAACDPAADRTRRRRAVLDMLAAKPALRYAWLTEPDRHGDYVVALAIRDVGTCELSIERECYDPFRLLELIAAGDPESSAADAARAVST